MVWPPPTISPPTDLEPSVPSEQASRTLSWLERPETLVGAVLGERYQLTEALGRGPLTWAFRGQCQRTGNRVIVKMLPGRAGQPTQQFLWQVREAISVSHYEHSAVQPIIDFGLAEGGDAWLVRNEAAGHSLRMLIQQGRMAEPRALTIACQLTDALVAAHAHEVVHGRLKPENILVDDRNAIVPTVRIVDFGLTQLGRGTALNSNEARLLGLRTRLYLPPSWTPSAPSLPRDDLYSVGVLLFEMLVGQPPFAFDQSELEAPLRTPPPGFSQYAPPVQASAGTEQLVSGLLNPTSPESQLSTQHLLERLQLLLTTCAVSSASQRPHPPPMEPEDEVTRAVQAISTPPGEHLPVSRPPAIAAFERPHFNPQVPSEPPRLPLRPSIPALAPAASSIFPPPSIAMSPVALAVDLSIPEPPRLSFFDKLKRLFGRSPRPPGF